MEDESGHPASLCIDESDGMPVALEVNPPGAQGPIRIRFDDWREVEGIRYFHFFELTEGPERTFTYRYRSLEPNGVAADRFVPSVAPALQADPGDGQTLYKELPVPNGKGIPYAVHLPDGFDSENTYPVLIGPGDGVKGEDAGFYWKTDPHSHGWIIVDAQLWEPATEKNLAALLDAVLADFKVEGGKFHAVCWSANSAGIFRLVMDHADRFHSITGMAGNPSGVSKAEIQALQEVKVQFVVGENDTYWQRSGRSAHEKLKAGGVDSVFEIVPDGEHVMNNLVGKGFMEKLEKLR
jgi:hypothetical protein